MRLVFGRGPALAIGGRATCLCARVSPLSVLYRGGLQDLGSYSSGSFAWQRRDNYRNPCRTIRRRSILRGPRRSSHRNPRDKQLHSATYRKYRSKT